MLKLGICLAIVFIACNLYGSQAKPTDDDFTSLLIKDPNHPLRQMLPLLDHIAAYRSKILVDEINKLKTETTELKQTMWRILAAMESGQSSLQESLKDVVPKDLNDRLGRVEDQQTDIQKSLGAQLEMQVNLDKGQQSVLENVQSLDKKLADLYKIISEHHDSQSAELQ
ncbi:uncharacterized protein [Drosophila takahashii]|uniref:uncharacterized protein n=1 Tax=Drosophila takahashii TaxID=29030 RepID=UPI001CF8FD2B|nr:uncharacterized protein LOC108069472 [Drosophila takahashii]